MSIKRIAILGGSGFVGLSLCNRLSREGYEINVLTRSREVNRDNLLVLPGLKLVQADVHDPAQLKHHLSGCDAVINLIGILNEKGNNGKGFKRAHVELVEKLITACDENNIQRILQMSALNADAVNGKSHYLRTKGEAEDRLHANKAGIHITSFRPSVIFGRDDSFFNRFAGLLKLTPLFFPLACYASKFAPVYVLDIAEIMAQSLKNPNSYGKRLQLCGPKTYTLEELVKFTANAVGIKRTIIPLNDILSRIQATVFDFVPGKPFSTDNFLSAKTDSVSDCNDLALYGINPAAIESVVPQYLTKHSCRSRYADFRRASRHSTGGQT
jgi:uncharacterized protein YbjT (DUF2867 family)